MTGGRHRGALIVGLTGFLLWARAASGHPLDEYVQASYLTFGEERVSVDIVLTAGVQIAARLLALVDGDGNGEISDAEGRDYADRVLREVSLTVDGRAVPLTLTGRVFPPPDAFLRGEGMIRLQLEGAAWSGVGGGARPGTHRLAYHNGHDPAPSAYLVNAYLPTAPFAITGQRRDWFQRGIEIDYTVAGGAWVRWGSIVVALLAVVAGGVLILARRRAARAA